MAALSLRAAPTHCPSPSAPVTALEPTSPAAGARHRCWPSVSAPPPPPCFSPASSPCWVRASSGARAETLDFHPIFYTIVFYFFCSSAYLWGGLHIGWGVIVLGTPLSALPFLLPFARLLSVVEFGGLLGCCWLFWRREEGFHRLLHFS